MGHWTLVFVILAACSQFEDDLVIERVDPPSGVNTDIVPVRIEGSGLVLPVSSNVDDGETRVAAITVSIGDTTLTDVVWRSEQLLEGSVPVGLVPGFYDVTLTLGDRSATRTRAYEVTSVPPPTPLGPWGMPVSTGVSGGADDPTLTDDLLELYFNLNGDIYVTTRASTSEPWGTAVIVSSLSVANETTPEVSYDGLTILFASDRAGSLGNTDIWVATRATRSDVWGTPTNVTELNSAVQETSSVMTPDGRMIVMTSTRGVSGSSDIYTSTRASASDPWMPPTEQTALNTTVHEGSPFLTADGLTVYFDSDRAGTLDLYMSTRASVNEPFPPAVPLTELNTAAREEDPWVSADGHHLYFFSDRDGIVGLWESAR